MMDLEFDRVGVFVNLPGENALSPIPRSFLPKCLTPLDMVIPSPHYFNTRRPNDVFQSVGAFGTAHAQEIEGAGLVRPPD